MNLDKVKIYWVKYRARSARGNALTGELKGLFLMFSAGGVILLLIDKYFGFLLPLWTLPIFWLFQKIIEYYLARFDQKVLGFWQAENDYISRDINPFNQELMQKINEIKDKLQ